MSFSSHDESRKEYRLLPLNAVALSLSVFSAAIFGLGRFVREAEAQTVMETSIALTLPTTELQVSRAARVDIEQSLRAMNNEALSLTYARLHATFRDYIGRDDLSVARALVDYAMLAEVELTARGIRRPVGTQSAAEMLVTYQLVL